MIFDPNNTIVKLCAEGMEYEGKGENEVAASLFAEAWNLAKSDMEKFTAAHYVARHQNTVESKLSWDETALNFALKISDPEVLSVLPSLYMNIAKCHEDLNDFASAKLNFLAAKKYLRNLPFDGYGNMIKLGVESGLERVTTKQTTINE